MSFIIKELNNEYIMICLANGDTEVVLKDSNEAKLWLNKLKV